MLDFQSQIRYVDRVGEGGLSDKLKIFMKWTCRALEKNAVWRPHVAETFSNFFSKAGSANKGPMNKVWWKSFMPFPRTTRSTTLKLEITG